MASPSSSAAHTRGTHRIVPPETTWSRIRPLLHHYGITRVADVTGLDGLGVPVFQAVRPGARTVSVSQGKGIDAMSARVSATMEAIELWHAENLPADATRVATPRELDLPYPIDALDLVGGSFVHLDLPLRWVEGSGLLTGAPVPVPRAAVHLDHLFAPVWDPPLFRATSNGLASGNSIDEATVHALAELCERDSLARLRETPPGTWARLDLASVPDADVAALLTRLASDGSGIEVVIASTDPPCLEARIRSPLHPVTFTGAGCHLDPVVALLRALTEAAQSRLTAITGARDDLPDVLYTPARPLTAASEPEASLVVDHGVFAGAGACGDLAADLAVLARTVADRTGYEPVRVPLPGPDGLAVVKVIGPGLRFDDRADVSRPAGGSA